MTERSNDLHWMDQALALGARAEGSTSPNPRVGCVLVRQDRVVGAGFHRGAGQAHAEATALEQAGAAAAGATLYVNLEPCAHAGRTPPCAQHLVRAGVSRVVAAMQDPDPRVMGRGFRTLEQAGIEVKVGLRSEAALRLNRSFVHWNRCGMPLVTLKAALSIDGMLSADSGVSRWISGPASRSVAHRLRLEHDAVLVGAGTLRVDDPRLSVRLPGHETHRLRVVLSASLQLGPATALFDAPGPIRIYSSDENIARRGAAHAQRATLIATPTEADRLDLRFVLEDLGRHGVQSILVEGGARTHAGFLHAGEAHRVALFSAPLLLGARGATPMLDMPAVDRPQSGWRIRREQTIALGSDVLTLGSLEAAQP